MKMTKTLVTLGCLALAAVAQANDVTFDFSQYGQNVNLGATKTFTTDGISLTASGFSTAGGSTDMFAKFTLGDPSETGLGIASDSDSEINTGNFIQLTLPTTPPSQVKFVVTGSIQDGESALIYWTSTAGTLTGATLIGSQTGGDTFSFTVPGAFATTGFLDITAGAGNILLDTVTVTPLVPDGGTTLALLGGALTLLGVARRKLIA